jgi:hypothetical protein
MVTIVEKREIPGADQRDPEKARQMYKAVQVMLRKHIQQSDKVCLIAKGAIRMVEQQKLAALWQQEEAPAPSSQYTNKKRPSNTSYTRTYPPKRLQSCDKPWRRDSSLFSRWELDGEHNNFPIKEIEMYQAEIDVSSLAEEDGERVLAESQGSIVDGKSSVRLFL